MCDVGGAPGRQAVRKCEVTWGKWRLERPERRAQVTSALKRAAAPERPVPAQHHACCCWATDCPDPAACV